MAQSQTLLQASFGRRSALAQALIVLGGSAVIALGAQISVPMLPVPMTLQTLAVVLVGLTAGARLGRMPAPRPVGTRSRAGRPARPLPRPWSREGRATGRRA